MTTNDILKINDVVFYYKTIRDWFGGNDGIFNPILEGLDSEHWFYALFNNKYAIKLRINSLISSLSTSRVKEKITVEKMAYKLEKACFNNEEYNLKEFVQQLQSYYDLWEKDYSPSFSTEEIETINNSFNTSTMWYDLTASNKSEIVGSLFENSGNVIWDYITTESINNVIRHLESDCVYAVTPNPDGIVSDFYSVPISMSSLSNACESITSNSTDWINRCF